MNKLLLSCIAVILVAVLAGYFFINRQDAIGEFWGSVFGTVLLGPTCPVVQDPPDPGCADKPYKAMLAVTTVDGARVIKEFSSDAEGKFSVELPPGEYAIRSAVTANILPYCQSSTFVIEAHGSSLVQVSCDTGIR